MASYYLFLPLEGLWVPLAPPIFVRSVNTTFLTGGRLYPSYLLLLAPQKFFLTFRHFPVRAVGTGKAHQFKHYRFKKVIFAAVPKWLSITNYSLRNYIASFYIEIRNQNSYCAQTLKDFKRNLLLVKRKKTNG